MADTTETDARSILDSRVADGFEELARVEHEPTRSGRSRREFNVDPNLHPVLLVEDAETGLLAWSFPVTRRSGAGVKFEFDEEVPAQQRGVLSHVGRKILRVLVPNVVDMAIEQAGRSSARRWEQTHRPEGLRRFDPEAASLESTDDGFQPEPEQLRGGSVLLLLHGPLSTTAGGFCDLRGLGLSRLSERYEGRVLGYDHFSLSKAPEENAAGLVAALAPLRDQQVTLDVIAHSRGGLVARKLAELALDPAHRIRLDNVWLVGSPNLGTPACDIQNLGRFADRMTNLLSWLPLEAVGDVVDGVLAVVQHLLLTPAAGLPGVAAMDPKAREVDTAPLPDEVRFFGIASEYAPVRGKPLADRAKHLLASPVLRRPNDLFVPQGSVFGPRDDPLIPPAHQLRYAPGEAVMHTGYFDHPNTVAFVLGSGAPRASSRSGAATVAFVSRQHSVVGEDSTVVDFSVTHASLEEAEYGLMVGSFADEGLSGAERYLDARLGGILRARYDIDHYPGELGSSMFIDPDPDRPTMPAAAYVVGLGPTTELGNLELSSAVRQALVRRCLRLYYVPHPPGGLVEVGVSSILMGVRNNDGLSIPGSVAGVAQGVIDANARLAQYEANLEQADTTPKVRVTRLEFVERYADRADAAAVAVRALPGTIRLGRGYDYLEKITVTNGPGGLPPGSVAAEGPIDWRRFLITEAPADEQPPTTSTEHDRPLFLDVALLGGDAGAGRIRHRLNRTIVDALVDRLAEAPDDTVTAATLYDHLVPDEIRQRFKTSGSVQLIVDAVTANYPFELLTAPRPGRRFSRQALAVSGSVLRQFTETGERRLSVHRATERSALVIGAGHVQGQIALPAAHAEAESVYAALIDDERYDATLLHDMTAELDLIELFNELFGNHRILHIASQGEYEEGKPELSGAILSSQYLLTVDTVRVLRWVPDLVFLNCCSLGRIGLPRLAAGLAREFTAIGTRAVVAVGWPIADSAALAFAEAFYDRMLGGAVFGDAVAAGRIAASEESGGQTWAAYQCYGDPAFDLAVPRSRQRAARSDPISRDDLLHRIASLGIRASDLRRVDGTVVDTGRASDLEELDALATWAADHRLDTDVGVQRQLAQVAKAFGDFGRAADRYRKVVTTIRHWYRPCSGASVADVREFANCWARDGQRRARAASTPDERSAAINDMCEALRAARSAVRLQPDKESWGIKGSTLKKLATIDEENRQAHLTGALQAYEAARACDDDGDYGADNALQLAAILGVERPASEQPPAPAVAVSGAGHRVIDQRQLRGNDFWVRAAAGDRALTRLLEAKEDDEAESHQHQMVDAYQAAFAARSTWSERNSCLEHLGDLVGILDPAHPRRALIESASAELHAWEAENVRGERRYE